MELKGEDSFLIGEGWYWKPLLRDEKWYCTTLYKQLEYYFAQVQPTVIIDMRLQIWQISKFGRRWRLEGKMKDVDEKAGDPSVTMIDLEKNQCFQIPLCLLKKNYVP